MSDSTGDERLQARRRLLKGAALGAASFAAGGWAADGASAAPEPPAKAAANGFNVRAFGATGDGRTSDARAVQAAIDACLKAGGGLVYIPAGRYLIGRTLRIGSAERVDIVGDGASSTLLHHNDEPLLEWPEGVSCRECSVRHLCFTSVGRDKSRETPVIACNGGAERSFFSHLLFNTAGAKMGSGIVSERVMDTTTIEHCLMWGLVSGTGIRVARGSEVRIFGGRIIGASGPGKALDQGAIGVHLTGDNGGVHIVTTDLISLDTALLIGEAGRKSNREVFITHATFDGCRHGIRQIDHSYTSIAGCWAASSDEAQILIDESARGAIVTVSGGTIFNGGAIGRPGAHNGLVAKAGSFVMTGVAVRHNKGTGILVGSQVRDYTITGCRITDNGVGAVLRGAKFSFTGNVLARNGSNTDPADLRSR